MESTCDDEVVVGAELVQTAFLECPVIYQAAGLVDDHESEDSPEICQYCE